MAVRKWVRVIFGLLLCSSCWANATDEPSHSGSRLVAGNRVNLDTPVVLRVACFDFFGLNDRDMKSKPEGLSIDLLERLAKQYGWKIDYVHGTWEEGRDRLLSEEVDLMLSVTQTPYREQIMDFSREPIVELWGQVFVRPSGKIRGLSDLEGRTVGVLTGGESGDDFRLLVHQLGIDCRISEFATLDKVLAAMHTMQVDACVALNNIGTRWAESNDLVASTIRFSPFKIYYATKKGLNSQVLAAMDTQMDLWRQDKNSYYYEAYSRWMGGVPPGSNRWLRIAMVSVGILLLLVLVAMGWVFLLHRAVRKRTEELESASASLRLFFEQPLSLNLICDFEGVIHRVNQAWFGALGYRAEQMAGKKLMDFVHLEDQGITRTHMEDLAAGNRVDYFEIRLRHISGEYRVMALSAQATVESNEMYAVAVDITERKNAVKMVDELSKFPVQNPNPVMRVNREGSILFANAAATRYYNECGGADGKLSARAITFLVKAVGQSEPVFGEEICAGRTYVFCYSAEKGQDYINIYGMEITAQKRAEGELSLLSAAIRSAAEAVLITDPKGSIEYVNPAFERISGYSAVEVQGKNPRFLKSGNQDDAFYETLWDTINAGHIWSGRFMNIRKDGGFYVEDGTISPVTDSEGKITHFVGVKRDITHELEVEQQYRQSQKLESVGQLAGGVAHDLNNLLTPVLGYSQILMDDPAMPMEFRVPVKQILQSGIRARDLVRQLLTFSRKGDTKMMSLNLNEVLAGFDRLIRQAVTERVTVTYEKEEGLPYILADRGQIEQIIMNLVVNARDAMPEGGSLLIKTQVAVIDPKQRLKYGLLQRGGYISMSVSDSGDGMDEATQGKIFEPFFTTKEVGKGTGLGLSTVFGIVKQHNGALRVESELGQGTLFELFLPVSPAPRESEPVPTDRVYSKNEQGELWLVEDDGAVRDIVSVTLELRGYSVLVFDNPSACQHFMEDRESGPDLLITDVMMPEINGKELADFLREKWPQCNVLYMSGYSRDILSIGDLESPDVGFISKPFSSQELFDAVDLFF